MSRPPSKASGRAPRGPVLKLYLDSSCRYCRVAGALLRRLDRDGRLELTSFRLDESYSLHGLTPADVAREMHGVIFAPQVKVVRGFEALMEACARLPLCRILLPLLRALNRTGLGPLLYGWLAQHRPMDRPSRTQRA